MDLMRFALTLCFGGSGRRGFGRGGRRGNSPLQTGQYYAVLTVDGDEYEQAFRVLPDPVSATKQGVAR